MAWSMLAFLPPRPGCPGKAAPRSVRNLAFTAYNMQDGVGKVLLGGQSGRAMETPGPSALMVSWTLLDFLTAQNRSLPTGSVAAVPEPGPHSLPHTQDRPVPLSP